MESTPPTLLIVDDEPANIRLLTHVLKKEYQTDTAESGIEALEKLATDPLPDPILLDVMMPVMDGFEVCEQLKAAPRTAEIPVIFVTAMTNIESETRALEIGAVDFITKPISPARVRARVGTHINLQQAKTALAGQNDLLREKVRERTHELELTQEITILSMATLAETRDNETGNHIHRIQHYVRILAEQMHAMGYFSDQLTEPMIEALYKSAPLHDIGKVGVPDQILKKPGKLTDEEFVEMKRHSLYGRDAILVSEARLRDSDSSFLRFAREIAYSHHEKWDGSGYPEGLAEETIPLSARIMALGDVYDALISKRAYKPAFSHEKATAIILQGRGSHFDPKIVEAFELVTEKFQAIASQFSDN
ncbi:MAG: two-component system response regulator [endosymbiont of Seepiophila jonesi]|uniref:Two-component system response regulator n=1 Tax=endosymbiont of Lamellibrachia luymesi TaxID=2200907 RepID=A0A370DX44_9GAMM|nr:MAG: two-component system response regulator [endosymbiont of Lamellibrachia luymesi]RDH91908.1 MAG: two-component system response regulator [endosymbiont of Seepiophila jonesi]